MFTVRIYYTARAQYDTAVLKGRSVPRNLVLLANRHHTQTITYRRRARL
jgi:hypothetical protein